MLSFSITSKPFHRIFEVTKDKTAIKPMKTAQTIRYVFFDRVISDSSVSFEYSYREFPATPELFPYPVLPFYALSGQQWRCRHPAVEGFFKEISNFIFF